MNAARNVALAMAGLLIISSAAWAGPVDGPMIRHHCVPASGTNSYHFDFVGGEFATVFLRGNGRTELGLFVYDEYGYLVASDTDYRNGIDCVAAWRPFRTGRFTIKVVNRGRVDNDYRIIFR